MDSINLINKIRYQILSKIESEAKIDIINETYKHINHKNYNGKYYFILIIKSKKLNKLNKIKAHKKIFKAIENLMQYIHALSIKIK